jgi:uncharacterized membrane protein
MKTPHIFPCTALPFLGLFAVVVVLVVVVVVVVVLGRQATIERIKHEMLNNRLKRTKTTTPDYLFCL